MNSVASQTLNTMINELPFEAHKSLLLRKFALLLLICLMNTNGTKPIKKTHQNLKHLPKKYAKALLLLLKKTAYDPFAQC